MDYRLVVAAWAEKFAGCEDSLQATWELAAIEEKWGDSLFYSGETGCAAHYHAAMRALVPQGVRFESREENDRRMEAYTRISNRLYEVGPDGRSRSYQPPTAAKTERRDAVRRSRQTRTRKETELGRLYQFAGHHEDYWLAAAWRDAAKTMAANYPAAATMACDWSIHHFERYNKEWTTNLPASRWDSDGTSEIAEVHALKESLTPSGAATPPDWVRLLLEGDVRHAVEALPRESAPVEFQKLAEILADARKLAGR